MTGKRYSEKFKQEAVDKLRNGSSYREVSEATGASVGSLRVWVKETGGLQAENPSTFEDKEEIKRLRKALKESEQIRDILEKATAFFASRRG